MDFGMIFVELIILILNIIFCLLNNGVNNFINYCILYHIFDFSLFDFFLVGSHVFSEVSI
jgi:hypothetical protein